jgi:hypothetical protein
VLRYPQIRPVLANFKISTIDRHPDHRDPHAIQNQPSQGESNFDDSSGQFFSIYSKAAEEEDNKMVERWQEDAQGILIFVSPRIGNSCCLVHKPEHYRPVYFLLLSLHSLL